MHLALTGRRLTGALLAVASVLIAGGIAVAARGALAGHDGPAAVVRAYFAALARDDAPDALGYGTLPAGSQTLVTEAALRTQQRAAPLRHLVVLSTSAKGDRAVVTVGYDLDFASGPVTVSDDVAVHRTGGGWLLDATAVPTRFAFSAAVRRATIAGQRVPGGRALVFPGAVVVGFDSPYLAGTVGNDYLTFGAPSTTAVDVALTPAGRRAVAAGVLSALRRCLRDGGDASCPQPDGRYLPGSLRGTVEGGLRHPRVSLTAAPSGVVTLDARATARVRFQRLNFTDELRSGRGTVALAVNAETVAADPLSIRWTG